LTDGFEGWMTPAGFSRVGWPTIGPVQTVPDGALRLPFEMTGTLLDRRRWGGGDILSQLPPIHTSHQWSAAMAAKEKNKDLNDLFLDTLKDIYFAEKQILKALPKMAKAAQSDKLRAAFEKHHGETEGQIERLEQIFELLDKPARGKTCDAIQGILDEGKEIMDEYKGCEALDAGMLAAAQAVEHYEISRYGTLKQWATQLGMKDAVKLLDQTLQEEKKTDESLTTLAEAAVNLAAAA
jgi:ferritin-like metal-binding protein YciE